MARISIFYVFASSVILSIQAVPQSAIIDESFTDLVELPSLKRSEGERKYKLNAFGKEIDLDLEKTSDLLPTELPVYVYGEDNDGNPIKEDWTHRTDSFQGLYRDMKTGASVMVEEVEGETKMTGLIGEDLVIEPVYDISTDEDDSSAQKREARTHLRHIVYKVKKQHEGSLDNDYVAEPVEVDDSEFDKRATLPERIYVPVQVVVDYALWKKMARSEGEVIKYIKIFYNSVNGMYSTVSWPSVSISIYGITICRSASACSMVEGGRFGPAKLNAEKTLPLVKKYAYAQQATIGTDYALMMVMTGYDLCRPFPNGTCHEYAAGFATVRAACAPYRGAQTSKTGISENHGAYDGLKTVAHEIGHLIGMQHDGDRPSAVGVPGAFSCPAKDGYIMGQSQPSTNQFIWSRCSIEQLRWFVVRPQASCLLVKPPASRYGLLNLVPGKQISLDNQCKVLHGSSSKNACIEPGVFSGNDKLCIGLTCKVSDTKCTRGNPPTQGSYCGPQRFCKQGKCVCDPSAPKPTPPSIPGCAGDTPGIRLNGLPCAIILLSAKDRSSTCSADIVRKHCCSSVARYCTATPITCGAEPVTPRPSRPAQVFTLGPRTTYSPPRSKNCGKKCADSPNTNINGKTCAALLASKADKISLCDNPIVIQHCCGTRDRVCGAYHSITDSCDSSCQDNYKAQINGKKCVALLGTKISRENVCVNPVVRHHCCATARKVCSVSPFGTQN